MSHYFENDKNLKSEIRELSYKYNSSFFIFYSDNGVFSKNNIDYGSRLLIETYLKENDINEKRVLDVGCGYGRTLDELYQMGYCNLIGIDFAESMINRGRRQFP